MTDTTDLPILLKAGRNCRILLKWWMELRLLDQFNRIENDWEVSVEDEEDGDG